MPLRRAGTLLIPSGPSHDPTRPHLHVVCNDTDPQGRNLIVSITSWTNDLCDPTCRVAAFEHDWLTHDSYVLYRKASIQEAQKIEDAVNKGLFRVEADFNGQTFLRIRNGVCRSPQTPRKIKIYFGC